MPYCCECDEELMPDDEMETDNGLFCEDCYYTTQVKWCALCDQSFEFEPLTEPGIFHFCMSKELADAQNTYNSVTGKQDMMPGIYRADEFPFHLSWICGDTEIYRDSVTKVAELPDDWDAKQAYSLQICGNCISNYFLPRNHRQFLKEMNS